MSDEQKAHQGGRLPRTKDGYDIRPGMQLYFECGITAAVLAVWFDGTIELQTHDNEGLPVGNWKKLQATECGYSTREAAESTNELAKAQADRWALMEALKNLLGECENFGPHCPDIEAAMVKANDVIRAAGGWND